MIIELTAARALAPWFGASLYVWTNVIGVVLLALAGGYWFGGRIADRHPDPSILGRVLMVAAALSLPAPFLTGPLAEWLLPEPEALTPFVGASHVTLGSLVVTLLLFAPPIALLGMVGPFITRCLVDTGLDGGSAAGRTLAVSTVGSLLGTYLPAHFLIEQIGVRMTLLSATVVLLVAALCLLRRGRPAVIATSLLLVTGGLMVVAASTSIRGPLVYAGAQGEDEWREVRVLDERETAYQYVRVSEWRKGRGGDTQLRLSLDEGVNEFHSVKPPQGYLTGFYYDQFAVLPELFPNRVDAPIDVIVLGGGSGTMGRMLRGLHQSAIGEVVCVEIDPVVASLHEQFGWRPESPDRMVVGDGRVALRASTKRFDLVILDAYSHQIAIPTHLATVEFFRLVRDRLKPQGVFAINVSVPDIEGRLMGSLVKTLGEVFSDVWSVSVPGSWNALLLASPEESRDFRPRGGPEGADYETARSAFLAGLLPAPEASEDALLLIDDRAPMEQLARAR